MATTKKKPNMFLEQLKMKPMNIGADFTPNQENQENQEVMASTEVKAPIVPQQDYSESMFSDLAPVQPKREPSSVPDELIVAGIPMLVSAMMGRPGVGAGIAGGALVKGEQDKQKMRAAQAKKAGTKAPSDKFVEVWNPDTNRYEWKTASKSVGQGSPSTEKSLESYTLRADLRDEKKRGLLEDRGVIGTGELNEVQKKYADKEKNAFSSKIKKNDENMLTLSRAVDSLKAGTDLGDKVGLGLIMRIVESGRMSDEDRKYYRFPTSALKKIRKAAEELKTSRPNREVVRDAKEIIKKLYTRGKEYNSFYRNAAIENLMVNQGVPRKNAELYFKTYENEDVENMDKQSSGKFLMNKKTGKRYLIKDATKASNYVKSGEFEYAN